MGFEVGLAVVTRSSIHVITLGSRPYYRLHNVSALLIEGESNRIPVEVYMSNIERADRKGGVRKLEASYGGRGRHHNKFGS